MEALLYKEIHIKWWKEYQTVGKHSRRRTVISVIQLEAFAEVYTNAHYNSGIEQKNKKQIVHPTMRA
jgi:hypothetical protein